MEVVPGPGEKGRSEGDCWWPSRQLPQGRGHSLADGVQLLRLLAALLPLLPDTLGHAVPQADEAAGKALVDGVTLPCHADGLLARSCGRETELSPHGPPDSHQGQVSPGRSDTGFQNVATG